MLAIGVSRGVLCAFLWRSGRLGLAVLAGLTGHLRCGLGGRFAQRSTREFQSASGVPPGVLRCLISLWGLQVGVPFSRRAVFWL
ncbi:hypothetical protein NDU88_001416 [Pleurodeles waltl]|uniref:Secreted protein n=1 Tax=Pleurodeles waltl TaxID=8319 RepID=A0AAV7NB09_PLEWA|nr:hypothetical protein NDU88_001416 [Pleurodeles waltl]